MKQGEGGRGWGEGGRGEGGREGRREGGREGGGFRFGARTCVCCLPFSIPCTEAAVVVAGHHEFTVPPPNDAHAAHSARQPEQQRRRDTRDKNIKIYEGGHGREESFPHASFDSGVKNLNSPGNVCAAVLLVPRREQKVK